MKNKVVKLAVIRKNELRECPFGLPIPFGCKHAGTAIDRMAPSKVLGEEVDKEDIEAVGEANTRMLAWYIMQNGEISKCPYAAKLIEDRDAVECNYEDTAPGEGQGKALNAAPFYSQVFTGAGINGLYSYPIGYYSDYNISRNTYYGVYSLQGSEDSKELIRLAVAELNGNKKE